MKVNIEEKVLDTITKYNMIQDNDKVVIGVSGGPDSMTLLTLLNNLKEKLNINIYVAHINHMIREEADDETESYISVDNELTLQAVFEIFKERAKDTFNFID